MYWSRRSVITSYSIHYTKLYETATSALSLVVADARGVTVEGMTALRKQARENSVTLRVVRNTLAKRAFTGTVITSYSIHYTKLYDPDQPEITAEPGIGFLVRKERYCKDSKCDTDPASCGGFFL